MELLKPGPSQGKNPMVGTRAKMGVYLFLAKLFLE